MVKDKGLEEWECRDMPRFDMPIDDKLLNPPPIVLPTDELVCSGLEVPKRLGPRRVALVIEVRVEPLLSRTFLEVLVDTRLDVRLELVVVLPPVLRVVLALLFEVVFDPRVLPVPFRCPPDPITGAGFSRKS